MNISYKMTKIFDEAQLEKLFKSVGWRSASVPERLVKAMRGSDSVFSAWDGDNLVGLANVISDGEMTAYVHFLLVDPLYQGQKIGTELMEKVKERYRKFVTLLLIAENKPLIDYYQNLGFSTTDGTHMATINY